VRVWVDLTNSPHVLVLRPVIERLQAAGHEVEVTARDFAQTLELCDRHGIAHTTIGHHRGGHVAAKALGLASRSAALWRWAGGRARFDLAIGHGSNDVTLAARARRVPVATMWDYEWATIQHGINDRLAQSIVVPEAIPAERLRALGAREDKVHRFPGLKEEYYLSDFDPDPAVLSELGLDATAPIALVRTPPAVSLYHRFENPLFGQVLESLRERAQTVVLPRTPEQRAELVIDAPSLVALAAAVVSAGGTMNREAVALGTPVWTVFEGKLGAVDAELLESGRMHRLERPEDVSLSPPDTRPWRIRRDPQVIVDMLTAPVI
jgi:predicted glycosyltransferase